MSETMTPAEEAYFESGGATDPAAAAPPAPPPSETPHEGHQGVREPPPAPTESSDEAPAAPRAPQQATVPHQALHAEREARKAAEAELRQVRELMTRIGAALPAPKEDPAPGAAPIPDMTADPVAHIQARFAAHERQMQAFSEFQQQQRQTAEQQRAVAELASWGKAQEDAFAAQTPDYQAATRHLQEARVAELRALMVPEDQIVGQLRQDVMLLATMARQQGQNFAELVYGAAQARGFKKGAGGAAPPAPGAKTDDRAATISRGQALAAGVGIQGSPPPGKMTAERLADLNEREFAKWVDKNPDDFDRLMGRA